MTASEKSLIETIRRLPPQRMAEVEDFVDFLRGREAGQPFTRAGAEASESSFSQVWNNEDNAAYDRL